MAKYIPICGVCNEGQLVEDEVVYIPEDSCYQFTLVCYECGVKHGTPLYINCGDKLVINKLSGLVDKMINKDY